MGVTGLWRLIEPAGKPVPVETLENKVLAVDISIWLHQMVKGYQDARGAPLPNAHLMGLFQRLCKLLYFKIKPVFVFDGGFPDLKRETIAKRQDSKSKYNSESERIKRELALLLSKKAAVSNLLGTQISPKKQSSSHKDTNEDLFKLPDLPQKEDESESESDDDADTSGSIVDVHSIDVQSESFKKLPMKEKYDLLIELKETRKMNSWGKLNELPKKSDNFSDFQMQRLLKRRKVQECLEETEKEMGDCGMSINDLETLLNEEGIETRIDTLPTRRIAANNNTRFIFIDNMRKTLADAKRKKEESKKTETEVKSEVLTGSSLNNDEDNDELQRAIKMSLECVDEADTSIGTSKTDESWTSANTTINCSTDSEEEDGFEQPDDLSSAKAYIMQYSDFTHQAIHKIVAPKSKNFKSKSKINTVDQIIDELNNEKSVIAEEVDLSSSDDEQNYANTNHLAAEVDATQDSVLYIENDAPETVSIDTSLEDSSIKNEINKSDDGKVNIHEMSSSSGNEDFEEVPEVIKLDDKPVVELTLKMGEGPDEDDIFADVFLVPSVKNITDEDEVTPRDKNNHIVEITEKNLSPEENHENPKNSANESVDSKDVTDKTQNSNQIFRKSNVSVEESKKEEISNNINRKLNQNDVNIEISEESTESNKKINKHVTELINRDNLNAIAEDIQNEEQGLLQEKGRLDRIGRNITEQMTKEAQELLQIFGIPYIVAPMEAEAQCAFLETVKLTDGTITDDSDIWLFGGRTVYKNFFNQKKHVLQFLADRIEQSFNLTREQLVLLALLVGSDYTTGVTGVGPVTALEILASFPFNKKKQVEETTKQARYTQIVTGLQEFKKWVKTGKRTDNSTLKKKLKNVDLTDDFPSVRVVQAYMEPYVEKSEENFTWGELDITVLRDYTRAKFGWNQSKLDEIIKPVLKRIMERKTQKTVQDYFKRKLEFQSLDDQMSKRVKAAVQKMGPDGLEIQQERKEENDPKKKGRRKRRATSVEQVICKNIDNEAGPSKQRKTEEDNILSQQGVKIISQDNDGKSGIDIIIPKTDRYQEIIPQREKDKQSLLQNKMKAIELFRKTKLDKKRKPVKRRVNLPKEKAELSENSDSN